MTAFERLGRLVVRRHRWLLAAWAIALVVAAPIAPRIVNALRSGGFTLEGEGLVATAVKPGAEGLLVLRCWNARETAVEGAWVATVPIERAVLMRADETVLEELAVENNTARFRAGPRGLVTIGFRVTR